MIENRPDWCVSRQRSWGVPITAFPAPPAAKYIADGTIMDHVAEIFEKESSDVWFDWSAERAAPRRNRLPEMRLAAL